MCNGFLHMSVALHHFAYLSSPPINENNHSSVKSSTLYAPSFRPRLVQSLAAWSISSPPSAPSLHRFWYINGMQCYFVRGSLW